MSPTRSPTEDPPPTTASTPNKNRCWKDRMHKLDDKWSKVRPYVERLNGTIVPLRSADDQDRERQMEQHAALREDHQRHGHLDDNTCTNRNDWNEKIKLSFSLNLIVVSCFFVLEWKVKQRKEKKNHYCRLEEIISHRFLPYILPLHRSTRHTRKKGPKRNLLNHFRVFASFFSSLSLSYSFLGLGTMN